MINERECICGAVVDGLQADVCQPSCQSFGFFAGITDILNVYQEFKGDEQWSFLRIFLSMLK